MPHELFEWLTLNFSLSAFTSLIIIVWFARSTTRLLKCNDTSAVQASHIIPSARIGGVSIVIALIAAAAWSHSMNDWNDVDLLVVSALPVFLVGFS